MLIEINNQAKFKFSQKLIKQVIEKFVQVYQIKAKEISLAFVSNREIRKINKQYRGIDQPTDILSFSGEGDFFGEIVISPDMIIKQAKENQQAIKAEFVFILVHGLLHLIGQNDITEKSRQKMIKTGHDFIINHLK